MILYDSFILEDLKKKSFTLLEIYNFNNNVIISIFF